MYHILLFKKYKERYLWDEPDKSPWALKVKWKLTEKFLDNIIVTLRA